MKPTEPKLMIPFAHSRPLLKSLKPDRVQWIFIGLVGVGLCLHDPGRTHEWAGIVHVLSLFAAVGVGMPVGAVLALALIVDLIEIPRVLYVNLKDAKRRRRDAAIAEWLDLNWEHPMRPELAREYHEKFGSEP
jgi:hypothetical protein